jgi:adenosine deaminase
MSLSPSLLSAAPKVILHDHLDGGLRPATIIELAGEVGYSALPTTDVDDLATWFYDAANSGSLETYLETFTHTLAVMQTPEALERVAAECVEDLAADGVLWAEIRMAPELCTSTLALDDVINAMLRGLREGERRAAAKGQTIETGLLLCAMRHLGRHVEVAKAVVNFRDAGVVGFDIAGPERGFPASRLVQAFDYLRRNNIRVTIHAGEAGGLESIQDALLMGAERLGHGIEIAEDIKVDADGNATLGRTAAYVRDRGIALEICPTSNVQTGAATSIAAHPFALLRRLGFTVTVNTDNRLMSRTGPVQENSLLADAFGYGVADLQEYALDALRASFAPQPTKAVIERRIRDGFAQLSL